MTPLRLVNDSGQTMPTDRLPFPIDAVNTLARKRIERISSRLPAPGGSAEFGVFARELEQRLANTQQQLDQLRDDVDSFPLSDYSGGGRAA